MLAYVRVRTAGLRLEFLPRGRSRTFENLMPSTSTTRIRVYVDGGDGRALSARLLHCTSSVVRPRRGGLYREKEIISRARSLRGNGRNPSRRLARRTRVCSPRARGHRFGQGRSLRAFNVLFARSLSPVCTRCPEPIGVVRASRAVADVAHVTGEGGKTRAASV